MKLISKTEIMNLLKINLSRTLFVLIFGCLSLLVACSEDEEVIPEVTAFFQTRTEIDAQNPLEAPADVVFVNGSKNGTAYFWDFGEAYLKNSPGKNTYEGVSPDTVHFPMPGTYDIKVTVKGGKDGDITYNQTYVVEKLTPVITYSPMDILSFTDVQFDVNYFEIEGKTATFNWTFEDGEPATSTAERPVVQFTSGGIKKATLNLNDGEEVLTVSMDILVKEELAPTLYFTDLATNTIYKKRIFDDKDEDVESTGIILQGGSLPMTLFVDNTRIYATNTNSNAGTATFGEIIAFHLDGSDRTTVATGGSGHYVPFSLTIAGNDLYFTDRFNGIHKINKTGVDLPIGAGSLFLHHNQTEFYGNGIGWGHQNGTVAYYDGKLWLAKNSNGRGVYLFDPGLPKNDGGFVTGEKLMETFAVRSFILDENSGKMYFFINQAAGANPIGMYVSNTDGTELQLIEAYAPGTDFDGTGGSAQYLGVTGIAVLGDYVYWGYRSADNAAATSGVKRAKLDGSEVEMFVPGYVPLGIAIDPVPR